MQVHDPRHVRPEVRDRVELGCQVVEVEQVGAVGTGRSERSLPHRREVARERRIDRGEDHVGHTRAVFEGRVHRLRCRDRVATLLERAHRVGRVDRVDVQTLEERRRVGPLTDRTE